MRMSRISASERPVRRGNARINGIDCDPNRAELVAAHPGDDYDFLIATWPESARHFDEALYRTPEGFYFVVRPMAPDEAEAWLVAHQDAAVLLQEFPETERQIPA